MDERLAELVPRSVYRRIHPLCSSHHHLIGAAASLALPEAALSDRSPATASQHILQFRLCVAQAGNRTTLLSAFGFQPMTAPAHRAAAAPRPHDEDRRHRDEGIIPAVLLQTQARSQRGQALLARAA